MIKLEHVVLELLEYKIEDVKASRPVKGGLASTWDLYNHLFKEMAVLSDFERSRVDAAGKILRRFGETSKTPRNMTQTLETLVLEDAALLTSPSVRFASRFDAPILEMDPEVSEEQAVLQRLAKRVWWSDLEGIVYDLAVQCRAEKDRVTARLLHALSRNLNRYLSGAQGDLDLSQFKVEDAVPERGDPLVSLSDLDVLSDMVRDLVETIMGLSDGAGRYASLNMPRGQALGFVKRLALAVTRDPYGGAPSPVAQRKPSSDQLRLALGELAKEPLREEQMKVQRATLTERLRITTAFEKQQRTAFQQDVQNFSSAVHSLFNRLERHLPGRAGGEAGEPQLSGGVLFAVNPALRVANVATGATAVTVHLKGPTRFLLGGLEIAVTGGRAPLLYVGGRDYLLQPRLRLSLEGKIVVAIHEGNYLHLSVRDEERSLAAVTAEALAVYFVLSSPHKADLLRVLRTAANVATGEPKDLVAQALERLHELSGRAPNRRHALTGLVRGAARAVGANLTDSVVEGLVQHFSSAMTVAPDELETILAASGAEVARHRLVGESLSLHFAGQPITVREYRNRSQDAQQSVAVTLPDRTVGTFQSYLIQPLPDGTLLCVRAAEDLVCLYFDGVTCEV